MLERFTREARAVAAAAADEARRLGAPAVGAEHLLVAVVARTGPSPFGPSLPGPLRALVPGDPPVTAEKLRARLAAEDPDAEALAAIGISLPEVRRRIEEAFGPGVWHDPRGRRLPYAREAKQALELGLREALELGLKRIDTRVVLLGLLREENAARRLVAELGPDPDEVSRRLRASIRELHRFAGG